ncbi:MAG: HPF/RaiA family ribosome-associated protein [Deltaproteobacteria bacterium]|nr:HPF/RaiA family ribosome-associated protein [Deltaproteobacteria bacterium]
MDLVLRTTSVQLSEAIRGHVDACVDGALVHVPRLAHGARVGVWLSDLNGPRGGVDKACVIVLHVPQHETIRVEERDIDLSAAIARAAERLREAVERGADRRRTRRERGARAPAV